MNMYEFTEVKQENLSEIESLLLISISEVFERHGVNDFMSEVNIELQNKMRIIKESLNSKSINKYYLIMYIGTVIGIIGYGAIDDSILLKLQNINLESTVEIKSAYILPSFQGKGVGTFMVKHVIDIMRTKSKYAVLGCGFADSQKFWTAKFGLPTVVEKNKWGDGLHNMIWKINLKKIKL